MAAPLTDDRLLQALRAEGVDVVEHTGWRVRARPASTGAWGPINGVMVHHTVTSGTSGSVDLCIRGHSSLPGPLCHLVISKDGQAHLISNGRANHAGRGDSGVLARVRAEDYNRDSLLRPARADTDGNARFYGFECINLGDGRDPWPEAQRDCIVRAAAAICRVYGWGARSVIGHLEWQPGKIDPRTGSGGVDVSPPTLRRLIDERLAHPATWSPGRGSTTPEEDDMPLSGDDLKRVHHTVWRTDDMPVAWGTDSNPRWTPESMLHYACDLGRENRGRIKAIQETLAAQSAAIRELAAALAARDEAVDVDALVSRIESAIERMTVRVEVASDDAA
ncbi:N-acetylmuramoyl-L-alanine amidase [Streptomyces desertarenae]|uniref:N-acetylmuramoyl-L-alanine amidase n=1 Tax=Streptomyces desertarenae TaxID=2666184 RepID=A0ABW4PSN0_9ACTN